MAPLPTTLRRRHLHRPPMARPSQRLVTRHPLRHLLPRTLTASRSRFRGRHPPRASSSTTMTPPLGSNSIRMVPTNLPQLTPKHRPKCTLKSRRPSHRPLPARRPSCPPPSTRPPPHPRVLPLPSLPLLQNIDQPIPLRLRTPQTRLIHTTLPIPRLPPPLLHHIRHTTLPPATQQIRLLPHSVPPPLHPMVLPLLMVLHTPLIIHIQPLLPLTPTHLLRPLQPRLSHRNRTHTHTHHPITCPRLLLHPHMLLIPGLVQRTRAKDQHHLFADIHKSRIPGT